MTQTNEALEVTEEEAERQALIALGLSSNQADAILARYRIARYRDVESALPPTRLPLPGQRITLGDPLNDLPVVVIASVYLDGEGPTPSALLLVVFAQPMYYGVVEANFGSTTEMYVSNLNIHPNIVPAVRDYERLGGDY